jgi:hypothetical protein
MECMKIRMFNFTCFPVVSKGAPEIVIAYEDAEMQRRVKQALNEVLGQQSEVLTYKTAEWKFSLLEYPGLLRQALEDAGTADIIVVAAHGKHELPDAVKNWIGQWSQQSQTRGGILLGVLEERWKDNAEAERILAFLSTAAAAADFEWFPSFFETSELEPNSHVEDQQFFPLSRGRGRPRVCS